MPALPDELSSTLLPGESRPSSSAESSMRRTGRSLSEPPGLRLSSLASTSTSGSSSRRTSRGTIGVLPMALSAGKRSISLAIRGSQGTKGSLPRHASQLVGLALEGLVDLRLHVEVAVEDAPARHPFPRPARLLLGDRRRIHQADAIEVVVLRLQRLNLGPVGMVLQVVGDVAALVGVDAPHRALDAAEEGGVDLGGDRLGRHDPGAVEERGPDDPAASLL